MSFVSPTNPSAPWPTPQLDETRSSYRPIHPIRPRRIDSSITACGPTQQHIQQMQSRLSARPDPKTKEQVRLTCLEYQKKIELLVDGEARLQETLDTEINNRWWLECRIRPEGIESLLNDIDLEEDSQMRRFLSAYATQSWVWNASKQFLRSRHLQNSIAPAWAIGVDLYEIKKERAIEIQQTKLSELNEKIEEIQSQLQTLRSSQYGKIRADLVKLLRSIEILEGSTLPYRWEFLPEWEILRGGIELVLPQVEQLLQDPNINRIVNLHPTNRSELTPSWFEGHSVALKHWNNFVGLMITAKKTAREAGLIDWSLRKDDLAKLLLTALCNRDPLPTWQRIEKLFGRLDMRMQKKLLQNQWFASVITWCKSVSY